MSALPHITVFRTPDNLAAHAAYRIVEVGAAAIRDRGRFTLALAGGSTPERTYAQLSEGGHDASLDWNRVMVFFGDERFVPHDDSRSNYGMARRALLDSVPIPSANVYPIPTDRDSPEASAAAYNDTLEAVFEAAPGNPPRFDLILLGLGDDGHIASLFPHAPALSVSDAWATASPPGRLPPPVDRITLTYPVINAAHEIWFLVTGAGKSEVIHDILENHPSPADRPAAGVQPEGGTQSWLLDDDAARLLTTVRGEEM